MVLTVFFGCKKNDPGEIVEMNYLVQGQIPDTIIAYIGDEVKFGNLTLTDPNTKVAWIKNGQTLSRDLNFAYVSRGYETFKLKLQAALAHEMFVKEIVVIITEKDELIISGSLPAEIALEKGEYLYISKLSVAPSIFAEKPTVAWKLNGIQISTERLLKYLPELSEGNYPLVFEATYKGVTKSVSTTLKVITPVIYPTTNYVVAGFLAYNGVPSDVRWDKLTHVYISSVDVNEDASLNTSHADIIVNDMVTQGKASKVKVMLSVNGKIEDISGFGIHMSNVFGQVLIDTTKRTRLIQNIVNYVLENRLDGVDLNYTDTEGSLDGNTPTLFKNNIYGQAFTLFVKSLKAKLPANKLLTASLKTKSDNGELAKFEVSKILPSLDWINLRIYGYLTPKVDQYAEYHALMKSFMCLGFRNIYSKDVLPDNKIVWGIPLFALYIPSVVSTGDLYQADGNAKWMSQLDVIRYPGYDISVRYAGDRLNGPVLYYEDNAQTSERVNYVKTNSMKGIMFWSLDQDAKDDANSVVKFASELIGN